MTVPGGVDVVGIEAWDRLGDEEELTFDVDDAVLSVDGERHMELQDAHVAVRPVPEGPRILRFDAAFDAVRGRGCFDVGE